MTTRKPAEPKEQAAEGATVAGRKLATAVHLNNTWYQPGDEVPADVAEQINNESVWATDDSQQ